MGLNAPKPWPKAAFGPKAGKETHAIKDNKKAAAAAAQSSGSKDKDASVDGKHLQAPVLFFAAGASNSKRSVAEKNDAKGETVTSTKQSDAEDTRLRRMRMPWKRQLPSPRRMRPGEVWE